MHRLLNYQYVKIVTGEIFSVRSAVSAVHRLCLQILILKRKCEDFSLFFILACFHEVATSIFKRYRLENWSSGRNKDEKWNKIRKGCLFFFFVSPNAAQIVIVQSFWHKVETIQSHLSWNAITRSKTRQTRSTYADLKEQGEERAEFMSQDELYKKQTKQKNLHNKWAIKSLQHSHGIPFWI